MKFRHAILVLALGIQYAMALGPVGHMRVVVDNWNSAFDPVLHTPLSDKTTVIAALAGALAPDAGYTVHRMQYFTDLAHYVRSGDLAMQLVRLAETPKYSKDKRFMAFALGFSTHYWADRYGHYYATNRLVAELLHDKKRRVTYENNMCYHTWVETQLSLLDVVQTPQILATGFIEYMAEMREPDDLLEQLYEFLKEGVEAVYPEAELSFKAYDLYRFYRFVAGLICMLDDAVKTVEPGTALGNSCKSLLPPSSSDHSDGLTWEGYEALIKTRLPLSPDLVERVYGNAREKIRSHVTKRADLGLENFNLDTNLPSRAGQYRCADSAFQDANNRASSLIPSTPDQKQAASDFSRAFSAFVNGGNRVRHVFGEKFSERTEKQAQAETDVYLFDIYPQAVPTRTLKLVREETCVAKSGLPFRIGQTRFVLQPAERTICYSKSARNIEVLYAQIVGARVLNQVSHGRAVNSRQAAEFGSAEASDYNEALDRLRLCPGEGLGQSGLYNRQPCPTCTSLQTLPF
jgi:hypothetical protein